MGTSGSNREERDIIVPFDSTYSELENFFGEQAFYKLDVETLATLSSDALFRLQALIMQALAEKLERKTNV